MTEIIHPADATTVDVWQPPYGDNAESWRFFNTHSEQHVHGVSEWPVGAGEDWSARVSVIGRQAYSGSITRWVEVGGVDGVFTASQARQLAAALLNAADHIDGAVGK